MKNLAPLLLGGHSLVTVDLYKWQSAMGTGKQKSTIPSEAAEEGFWEEVTSGQVLVGGTGRRAAGQSAGVPVRKVRRGRGVMGWGGGPGCRKRGWPGTCNFILRARRKSPASVTWPSWGG